MEDGRTVTAAEGLVHLKVSYFRTHTAVKLPETDKRQLRSSAGGDCGVEGGDD